MKKMFFALLVVTLASSLCFAQQPSAPVAKAAPAPVVTKTLVGTVDAVLIGDAVKGVKSQIAIVDDKGQKMSLTVKSGTPINAKDGKKLTLSEVKKGNKVVVEYTINRAGTHKAQSIKLAE